MIGLIHRVPSDPRAASFPIAGLPLVVRQMQVLRVLGATSIVIEHAADISFREINGWLQDEALTCGVVLVSSTEPLGPYAVAEQGNVSADERIIAVPEDILFDADLAAALEQAQVSAGALRVELRSAIDGASPETIIVAGTKSDLLLDPMGIASARGWAARAHTLNDALALSSAALQGKLGQEGEGVWPVQIHGSEIEPGVWLARGARVEPGARVIAPVFLGPDSLVRASAEVGPNAMVGRGVVVDRGASVQSAIVFDDVVLGEGVRIDFIGVTPRGLLDLATREEIVIDDPALVGSRANRLAVSPFARLTALVMLTALAIPSAALGAIESFAGHRVLERERIRRGHASGSIFRARTHSRLVNFFLRLADVVLGRRTLVGVDPSPPNVAARENEPISAVTPGLLHDASHATPGAILIDDALVGANTTVLARLRMHAGYAVTKSFRTDAALLSRQLFTVHGRDHARLTTQTVSGAP